MDERYRKISTGSPKLARTGEPGAWGHGGAPGNEAGRVTMKEYLVPAVGVGSLNEDRARAIEAWRQRYGFTTTIDGEPKIEDVIGTIFGKKQDSGKWEFYYQKLMCVSALFWDPVKHSLTPKCEWQVISCSKFWPGVGAHSRDPRRCESIRFAAGRVRPLRLILWISRDQMVGSKFTPV